MSSAPSSGKGSDPANPSSASLSAPETGTGASVTGPKSDDDPLANVPDLTNYIATTSADKVEALKLVADSIAQQRQSAARAMIFHPFFLALVILLLGMVGQFLYKDKTDLPLVGTTWIGCVMAALILVRGTAGGYLPLAEKINWRWLMDEEQEKEDEMMISRFGDEVIGACVFRIMPEEAGKSKTRKRKAGGKAVIRAWTVKLRYRGKGIGESLLEDVVNVCVTERGCESVEFDKEHANSARILPSVFNAKFEKNEARARKKLEDIQNLQLTPRKR